MKIGILPLARATFDVPFAEANLASMLAALDATECQIAGPRDLLFDDLLEDGFFLDNLDGVLSSALHL